MGINLKAVCDHRVDGQKRSKSMVGWMGCLGMRQLSCGFIDGICSAERVVVIFPAVLLRTFEVNWKLFTF